MLKPYLGKGLLVALTISMGLPSCAKKPSKRASYGSFDNVFKKSDFAKAVPMGSYEDLEDIGVAAFIEAALVKESSTKADHSEGTTYHVGNALRTAKNVQFRIDEDHLTLYDFDESKAEQDAWPIAQWSIQSHCRAEVRRNERGEETRYIEPRCGLDADWRDADYFRAVPTQLSVRQLEFTSYDQMFAKAALGKPFSKDQMPSDLAALIEAATKAEEAQKSSNFIKKSYGIGSALQNAKTLTFTITQGTLSLYDADKSELPIAQWSIDGHCQTEAQQTAKGQKTPLLTPRCDLGSDWAKAPLASVVPSDVIVRKLADQTATDLLPQTMFSKDPSPYSQLSPELKELLKPYYQEAMQKLEAPSNSSSDDVFQTLVGRGQSKAQMANKVGFVVKNWYMFLVAFDQDQQPILNTPLFQWSINGYYDLLPEETSKGEPTPILHLGVVDSTPHAADRPFIQVRFDAGFKSGVVNYSDRFVHSIKDVDGGTFVIRTGASKNEGYTMSRADKLVIGEDFKHLNTLSPVHFTADFGKFSRLQIIFNSQHLNTIALFGRPHSSYVGRFRFTENHLILSKIGNLEEISNSEKTYAQKITEGPFKGKFEVPIVGYPLTKYVYANAISDDQVSLATRQLLTKQKLSEATHFEAAVDRPETMEPYNKVDILPAQLFNQDDEWFYQKSVVDRPITVGAVPFEQELGAQLASGRVRIVRTKNSIKLVDVNVADELAHLSPEKFATILEIPANWYDFRLVKQGTSAYLREEVITNDDASSRPWYARDWMFLDFTRADHVATLSDNEYRLLRLEITGDRLNFKIHEAATDMTYMYSIAKAGKPVEGQNYAYSDRNTFGFFLTIKDFLDSPLNTREDVINKSLFANRMFPKDGVITFHLTNQAPFIGDEEGAKEPTEFYKTILLPAVKEAVKAWDQAFVKAAQGTGLRPIRVRLSEDMVELGDASSNTIAFYGFDRVSGLLGYGPSVSDPKTGEIFSATNHIYLNNYRKDLLGKLVNYTKQKLGLFEGKNLRSVEIPKAVFEDQMIGTFDDQLIPEGNQLKSVRPVSFSIVDEVNGGAELRDLWRSLPKTRTFSSVDDVRELQNLSALGLTQDAEGSIRPLKTPECAFEHYYANTIKEIEDICLAEGSKFRRYQDDLTAAHLQDQSVTYLEGEKEAFYECANKLLKPKLVTTLVHEFGHDFGLRHNFAGSTDRVNYPKVEEGEAPVRSSSVMDYAHDDSDRGTKPGPYDIAAIRFGYYQHVELANGSLLPTVGTSLEDLELAAMQTFGMRLKHYKYCTDYDIGEDQHPISDPECRRWDRGATPLEMARNLMLGIDNLVTVSSHRMDDFSLTDEKYFVGNALDMMQQMKVIYDHYRYLVFAELFNSETDRYFESINSIESYDAKVEALITGPNSVASQRLQNYHAASKEIFKFLEELAFSPAKYCKIVPSEGDAVYMDFQSLRTRVYQETLQRFGLGETYNTCKDLVANWSAFQGTEVTVEVFDLGNFVRDIYWTEDQDRITEKNPLVRGLINVRASAMAVLASRDSPLAIMQGRGFQPNFLDNPHYRAKIVSRLFDRLSEGENLGSLNKGIYDAQDGFIPRFAREKELYLAYYRILKSEMKAPNQPVDTRTTALFPEYIQMTQAEAANIIRDIDSGEVEGAYLKTGSLLFFARASERGYAYRAIKKLNHLNFLLDLARTDIAAWPEGAEEEYLEEVINFADNYAEYDAQISLLGAIITGG